ncbi:Dr1-associated corepressor [Quillaja saponaria]|uniref:Dr1-associated corepressor n=1 Tax=Quillaja saponaria TaxID=32244 RepID=A0AAD7LLR6_QUISA|nr:Dr1-associated corepressor [Quillaja saponaria]
MSGLASIGVSVYVSIFQQEARHNGSNGRRRGRGRGRGWGIRTIARELTAENEKFENDPYMLKHNDKPSQSLKSLDNREESEMKRSVPGSKNAKVPVRNFDLNVDLDENGLTNIVICSAWKFTGKAHFGTEA